MLELEYNVFQEIVEKNRKTRNQDKRKLHYHETETAITLYIKSVDMWEYYTIVPMEQIIGFGAQFDLSAEESLRYFKSAELHDAVPIKSGDEIDRNLQKQRENEAITKEDSEEYDNFLTKQFRLWEKQIIDELMVNMGDQLVAKHWIKKGLLDFVVGIFDSVNTDGFFNKIRSIIRGKLKEGVEEAELQLNMDLGFPQDIDEQVDTLAQRQLDGFMIDNKNWPGLKGIAEEVQERVIEVVQDGVVTGKSLKEVSSELHDLMTQYVGDDEVTEGRATMIARTESNRWLNQAKLDSYQRSGLNGYKVWDAFNDNRTSEICEALHNDKVLLNQNFEYEGKFFEAPPAHPNCRSVLRFEPLE